MLCVSSIYFLMSEPIPLFEMAHTNTSRQPQGIDCADQW